MQESRNASCGFLVFAGEEDCLVTLFLPLSPFYSFFCRIKTVPFSHMLQTCIRVRVSRLCRNTPPQ